MRAFKMPLIGAMLVCAVSSQAAPSAIPVVERLSTALKPYIVPSLVGPVIDLPEYLGVSTKSDDQKVYLNISPTAGEGRPQAEIAVPRQALLDARIRVYSGKKANPDMTILIDDGARDSEKSYENDGLGWASLVRARTVISAIRTALGRP